MPESRGGLKDVGRHTHVMKARGLRDIRQYMSECQEDRKILLHPTFKEVTGLKNIAG